jgi:hypothetical protein
MFGGLAQLVERLLCKQDVSGSSPLTSTQRDPQTGQRSPSPVGMTVDVLVLGEEGFQPPVMPERVERKLNSACPERDMCEQQEP